MPIYDYQCRGCGHRFEALVLKGGVASCPKCESQDLEQMISAFAVSSNSISEANLQAARSRFRNSGNFKDKRIAEAQQLKEHLEEQTGGPRD